MKNKELKNFAKKIAKKQEIIDSNNSSQEEKEKAIVKIEELSRKVHNFNDLIIIDEMILEILSKQKQK